MGPGGHLRIGSPPGAPYPFLVFAGGLFAAGLLAAASAAPARGDGGRASGPIVVADRTAAAGLRFETTYGGKETSTYILETTGTGVAFLDYDRDGFLDVFFANGRTLENAPGGREPRSALFRNKGDGTFEDVTEKAGVGRSGWGQGVASA